MSVMQCHRFTVLLPIYFLVFLKSMVLFKLTTFFY